MAARIYARRYLWVVGAIMALFVSMVGVTALAQTDEGDVFTGCVNENSGVLSNVAVGLDPAKPCNPQESQITWDRAGPALEGRIAALEEQVAELEAPYGTLELTVDCAAGGTVGGALEEAETHLGPVNITISGVCAESVSVRRDDVSFRGIQRSDGILAGSTDPFAVGLFGANDVGFSNMTIAGGTGGGAFGSITANRSTFNASDITVRGSSVAGIILLAGSSGYMESCTIADNSGDGVGALTGGTIALEDCEITGNSGGGVSVSDGATVFVGNSEITNNGDGVGVLPGGNLSLSNTLVANNQFGGVFAIGGQLSMRGDTRIVGNQGGVALETGASLYIGTGPVVVEDNRSSGIMVYGGASLRADELIVRNNTGHGITIGDLSTVSVGPAGETAQITDNGGWGINCAGPPAVAVVGGQGLFNPSNIVFSGNTNGDTNCS